MIELTCRGCGREGRIPDHFVNLRVTCRRCRAISVVPDVVTREDYVVDWTATIDASWNNALAESPTVEIECRPSSV